MDLDLALGLGHLLTEACPKQLSVAPLLTALELDLAGELVQTQRPEDPLLEELLNQQEQGVFSEIDPLLVGVRLDRGCISVAGAVGAGVVVVAFAGLALHREWLVAGGAVDHPSEQVGAFRLAGGVLAGGASPKALLGLSEQFVGDQR